MKWVAEYFRTFINVFDRHKWLVMWLTLVWMNRFIVDRLHLVSDRINTVHDRIDLVRERLSELESQRIQIDIVREETSCNVDCGDHRCDGCGMKVIKKGD